MLILTGSYGGGHEQAARALEQAFNAVPDRFSADVLDVTSLMPQTLDALEKRAFLAGVTHFPSVYHFFYRCTQKNNPMSAFIKAFTTTGMAKLIPIIESARPNLIISSFPPAAIMVSRLKRAGHFIDLPFLTVITDYSVHSTWVNAFTDAYLVASDEVRRRLIAMHVDPRRILVTGIPIQPDFSMKSKRALLRQKYGFSDRDQVLLIMGGGCGIFGHYTPFLKQLENGHVDHLHVIVICGHNEKAVEMFNSYSQTSKQDIRVLGFVNNMNEWMALADLLMTKPGGLTVSEAIASELPMLIYRPLGGQEMDNTKFLLRSGMSVAAFSAAELITMLTDLLQHPSALAIMRENMNTFSHNQQISAERAVTAATAMFAENPVAIHESSMIEFA